MACRGVHFAITNSERGHLESLEGDAARISYIREVIEHVWDNEFLQETDKAWDAIHRCLGDFPAKFSNFYPIDPKYGDFGLPEDYGTEPLKFCVLGGKRLIERENMFIMRLIESHQVEELARALEAIDGAWITNKYHANCAGAWPEYGEQDLEYTWEWFARLKAYFVRMAGNGRAIIFTADQ